MDSVPVGKARIDMSRYAAGIARKVGIALILCLGCLESGHGLGPGPAGVIG